MKKIKKISGFTLVELLISISIIAILAVVLSISFSNIQKDSRDQRRIEDMKAIQSAAEQYYFLNNNLYPSNSNYYVSGAVWPAINGQTVLQKYPTDPKNDSTNGYVYTSSGVSTNGYCVCAKLERPTTRNSNAENTSCNFANTGYFCIKNQQ